MGMTETEPKHDNQRYCLKQNKVNKALTPVNIFQNWGYSDVLNRSFNFEMQSQNAVYYRNLKQVEKNPKAINRFKSPYRPYLVVNSWPVKRFVSVGEQI